MRENTLRHLQFQEDCRIDERRPRRTNAIFVEFVLSSVHKHLTLSQLKKSNKLHISTVLVPAKQFITGLDPLQYHEGKTNVTKVKEQHLEMQQVRCFGLFCPHMRAAVVYDLLTLHVLLPSGFVIIMKYFISFPTLFICDSTF